MVIEKHEPNSQCITVIHEIINKAEELIDTGQFNGDLDRIYSLVNRFIRNRPVCILYSFVCLLIILKINSMVVWIILPVIR